MSRSNPSDNTPNPSTRWFEWHGSSDGGVVRHYDKESKSTIVDKLPFTFIVLDELARVSGWHEPSESGIFSNEVRDTRQDVMVVRSYKGGDLAVGLYAMIRDRVAAIGGHFEASIYIAYKGDEGTGLRLGNISFKGAALAKWMEFRRAHRADLYKQAVGIYGYTEGKKGSVVYRVPQLRLQTVGEASNAEAIKLDEELQAYLKGYLSRTRDDQARAFTEAKKANGEAPATEYPAPLPTRASREAVEDAMLEEAQNTPRGPDGFEDSDVPF